LHHILEAARRLLHEYGYAGLFALIFGENFGLPLPGETIFIAAVLLTAHGEMKIVPVVLCAWTSSVLGGIVGFAIGRFGGSRLLQKYGRYVGINAERLLKIEAFFARYGVLVVILGRFFEGMRQIYAILAGSMETSWRKFLIYNVAGATLWVGFWTALVLWFGRHLRHIWDVFKEHEVYVLLSVALICALSALLLHLRERRDEARNPNDETSTKSE
jgi:membrane protein DedA with SNARE-associated domain